jgi:hypothetical protein
LGGATCDMPWRMARAIVVIPPCARNNLRVSAKFVVSSSDVIVKKLRPQIKAGTQIHLCMPTFY